MRAILLLISLFLFVTVQLHAQTNDPLINQQYYIGAHNIDQLWNTTTGSSNTRIAVHSATGFTSSHEDMTGSRYLNPYSNWFSPEKGFASELAGIVAANSDNNIGMAGINWNATLKSYNFVEANASNPDPDYEFTSDNIDYYLSIGNMSTMLDAANTDNMDVHLFSFGVPTSNVSKLSNFNNLNPDPYTLYKFFHEGSDFPEEPPTQFPTQEDQFKSDFQQALENIGQSIWNAITNPTYSISSPYETFRGKLWDSAENHNSILLAPVGDVAGDKIPAPILMPFSFDDFVIGVGGGETVSGQLPTHWDGAGESSYVNITAAAKDLVTLSGEDYDSYNTEFSSTTGSAAIVAGVASLLIEEVNDYSYEDIRYILQNSAIDIEDPGTDDKTGDGWLDAQAALNYVQSNDFVRESVPKSNITTISDTQDNSYTYKLDKEIAMELCPGSSTQILSGQGVDGWINTFKGRIDFENSFSSAPDVWLRNSSSGTDVNPTSYGSGLYQFYEPYNKDLKVTSVDNNGFEFEMRYWSLKAYNSYYGEICTGDFPNINNIQIDYTAVGVELLPPPPAPVPQTPILQGTVVSGSPSLSWNAVPWGLSYQLNRNSTHPQVSSETIITTNTSYVDPLPINVEVSWEFFGNISYTVQAVNFQDVASPSSNAIVYNEDSFGTGGGLLKLEEGENLPKKFALINNYPNPFNPTSTIRYDLPERADVTLAVYNMLGMRVATLLDGMIQPGQHETMFDASALSSGNYIARFTAIGVSGETFEESMNMQLVK